MLPALLDSVLLKPGCFLLHLCLRNIFIVPFKKVDAKILFFI